jgi:hypothetical protein
VIVQTLDARLLLITQPAHAELAGRVMGAWQANGLRTSTTREAILLATREHDFGWTEPDAAPIIDGHSGRILDFINAPDAIRQAVWPRSVDHLRRQPYAAALVAEHALTIYERYRELPEWDPFFAGMEQAREEALARAAPATKDDLARDYFFVRAGDLISLAFCNAWRVTQRFGEYHVRVEGTRLLISPDPFDGAAIPLTVTARALPNRRYASREDGAVEYQRAAGVALEGLLVGDARAAAHEVR